MTGHPYISGEKTDLALTGFSTPFLENFSHLTPYLGNILTQSIQFILFYLLSFGLGKYVYIK